MVHKKKNISGYEEDKALKNFLVWLKQDVPGSCLGSDAACLASLPFPHSPKSSLDGLLVRKIMAVGNGISHRQP